MARQQVVSFTITCDVCGDEIPEDEVEDASRKIGWEGTEYLIDLCAPHRAKLSGTLDGLKVFVDAGRRTPTGRRGRPAAKRPSPRPARGRRAAAAPSANGSSRSSALAEVRAWAQANGHRVGDRGRIPATIMAAYKELHEPVSLPATPKRRSRKAAAPAE